MQTYPLLEKSFLGGLGDVAGELSHALDRRGHKVMELLVLLLLVQQEALIGHISSICITILLHQHCMEQQRIQVLRSWLENLIHTAIPILIGTKFDNFVQLPPDIQWCVVTQGNVGGRI